MKKHYKGIPKTIHIGPQAWTILPRTTDEDPTLNDCHAYTIVDAPYIVIRADKDVTELRSTLFHELLHAIRLTFEPKGAEVPGRKKSEGYGNYQERWEHYFISLFDGNVITVMRENPELRDFLFGGASA